MLDVYAPHFVRIGQMYGAYMSKSVPPGLDPSALADEATLRGWVALLEDLSGLCKKLEMPVSTRILERAVGDFRESRPAQSDTKQRLSEWYSCFVSELETRMFKLVLPHREPYYVETGQQTTAGHKGCLVAAGREASLLLEALGDFSGARYDAVEAGKCIAFERFTASVYHLMRCAEYGLVSVATDIGVPEDRLTSWDRMIQGIESEIKNLPNRTPREGWKEREKKYSDLCSFFTTMKNGWRNPASHTPRVYEESTATGMFAATRTLFEHLAQQGFRGVPMSSEPIALPGG